MPRTPTVIKIANVWSVTGTSPTGMLTHEHTAVNAVNIAMSAMSAVMIFVFDFAVVIFLPSFAVNFV